MKFTPAYSWPDWLASSLLNKKMLPKKINKFKYAQKNLWQALNIYDDFFDGEGKPDKLPKANRYYRDFLKIIYLNKLPLSFQKISEKILNDLDLANSQEIKQNKIIWQNGVPKLPKNIPNFSYLKNLSKKSLALALAPIAAILTYKKLNEKWLINFFRYALAAKQLSDDAKDWLDDLYSGKLTAVNIRVIQEGKNRKIKKNLYKKTEILHLLFAYGAAIPTCYNILKLCKQARNEAHKLKINDKAPIIIGLILPLEKAANKALRFKQLLS